MDQIVDQLVDRVDRAAPKAAHIADRTALFHLPLLADYDGKVRELIGHALIEVDDVVQRFRDLARQTGPVCRQSHCAVATFEGDQRTQNVRKVLIGGDRPFQEFHRSLCAWFVSTNCQRDCETDLRATPERRHEAT